MNKEIKKRWVAALKSGKYQQGKGCLRTQGNKHCCLGVLCDLHASEKRGRWGVVGVLSGNTAPYLAIPYRTHMGSVSVDDLDVLPEAVREWADLDGVNPNVKAGTSLAELNDDGVSFEKIASYIQRKL